MKRFAKNYKKRIVIKIGTSILACANKIDRQRVSSLITQVIKLLDKGNQVILVSSGAIASGMSLLGLKSKPKALSKLQALAAIGQVKLMDLYTGFFEQNSKVCAQVLLTWDDFNNRGRYLKSKNTLVELIDLNVVAIVNENDTVSTDEIKFGDNDKLSALVANLIEADLLIILTDVDGLYDKDSKLLKKISAITSNIEKMACKTKKNLCVGGMSSKLEAAKIVTNSGIPCIIANGLTKDILLKIDKQEFTGTLFLPSKSRLKAKKSWIAFSAKARGKIFVDDGAKDALIYGKKSLLCVGVISFEGKFEKGDTVSIFDKQNIEFAKGMVECSWQELKDSIGKKNVKEVIHRDNLVVMG